MSPRTVRIVKRIAAIAVAASVVTCLIPAMAALIDRSSGRFTEFRLGPLMGAFALLLIYWPLNAYVWTGVLKALGHSLPAGTAVRIWLAAQTCRWLPGGVWHYGSRTMQSVAHGVPSSIAVASIALELLLTVAAWTVLVLVGVAVYGSRSFQIEQLLSDQATRVALWGSLGLVVLGGVAYVSWRYFCHRFQTARERFALLRQARPRILPTLTCFLAYLALSVINGVAFYAVILSFSAKGEVPLVAAVSANALAWLVGLFAIVAPGGLVVREAALAFQIGLWMPLPDAVLIAVLWRLMQLAVEVVCVAAAYAPQSVASRLAGYYGFSFPKSRATEAANDSSRPLPTLVDTQFEQRHEPGRVVSDALP